MKIAFFTPSLKIGGIEKVFVNYATKIASDGNEVTYLICNKHIEIYTNSHKYNIQILSGKRLSKSIGSIYKHLRNNKYDYIITGGEIPNTIIIVLNKILNHNTRVIISQHNYFNAERNILVNKIIIRLFYNMAHKIIAVSEGIKLMLIENGVNKKKICTIYNPLNINLITDLSQRKEIYHLPNNYICYIGRLGKVKNLSLLINSFALFNSLYKNYYLIIAGEGPEKENIVKYCRNIGVHDKVILLGHISNPYPIIFHSDAVILPSMSEALPTVIIESIILGKTVVTTPTLGAIDLCDNGKYCYISKNFTDEHELCELIKRAIIKPIDNNMLTEYSKNFNIDNKYQSLKRILFS